MLGPAPSQPPGGAATIQSESQERAFPEIEELLRQANRPPVRALALPQTQAIPIRTANGKYVAFISHYKWEAQTEARLLERMLQAHLDKISAPGAKIFLDSDDLAGRHLSTLVQAVRASGVLIVVLSKSVLTRPFCLLEMIAAIKAGVPIVCVHLVGTPSAYTSAHFSDAFRFLATLDKSLDAGAAAELRSAGVELSDAARLLAYTIPKIVSCPFDPSRSLAVLNAYIKDITDAIGRAKPSKVPDKLEWAKLLVSQRPSDESLSEQALTGDALCNYVFKEMLRQRKEFRSLKYANEEEEEAAKDELEQNHAIQLLSDKHLKLKDIKYYFYDNLCVVEAVTQKDKETIRSEGISYLDREPPVGVMLMEVEIAERDMREEAEMA